MSEDQTELTTIDVENMSPKEEEIYQRRMRVFRNRFLPKHTPDPKGEHRLTNEEMADSENVSLSTIEKDLTWIKNTYPNLWALDQVKRGFARTMMEVSGIYKVLVDNLYDDFLESEDTAERVMLAKTLNDLIPTYTNTKAHGTVLQKMKELVKDEKST